MRLNSGNAGPQSPIERALEPFRLREGENRAFVCALRLPRDSEEDFQQSLEELIFLCDTLGLKVVDTIVQKRPYPHARTYLGPGKLREIAERMHRENVHYLVVDAQLSPAQVYHIEQETRKPVLDRSDVILLIFDRHARTAQAKLQVELARLQHMLPRLKRMWTHLERQRGGIGIRAGAGEKEIEKDRRIITRRIAHLRRKLQEIEKQGEIRRARREEIVRVAMVGYTNVGKTTLMNLLAHEHLRAENRLFVTLDTTVRRVVLDGIPFLLSDTVGFIRRLPHHLVESFRATLREAQEADILLHVLDASHPDVGRQIRTVENTLRQIGIQNARTIYVCNKMDRLVEREEELHEKCLERIRELPLNPEYEVVCISALRRWNLDEFRRILLKKVVEVYRQRYPHVVPRIGISLSSVNS